MNQNILLLPPENVPLLEDERVPRITIDELKDIEFFDTDEERAWLQDMLENRS